MIRVPLENHSSSARKVHATVESGEGYDIWLTLEDEDEDGDHATRTLSPDEARCIAVALTHYANEATA